MLHENFLDRVSDDGDFDPDGTLEDGPVLTAVCKTVVADAVTSILKAVGEDPEREGLLGTPNRVARAYDELLVGYRVDPRSVLNNALFDVTYKEMVIVTDIDFYSLCEHHLLPFIGRAHVAYIPNEKVVGLSKIPRIVEVFARRLQIQERMTRQIAELIEELLNPFGVAVVVDGLHMCMAMRGVKKANARMRTSALRGAFADNQKTRAEFMDHVGPVTRTLL
ncbi:MAG TPA: GTP cyclohydrolase I FolE [Promineifilum sp.]